MTVTPAPPTPTKAWKAYIAFATSFLGTLLVSVQGRPEIDTLKWIDWLIIIGTALVTTAGVYGVTNPPKTHRYPSGQPRV